MVQSYRQQHPEIEVTLTELSSEAQVRALVDGTIDVGFIHASVLHPELLTHTVVKEPLVVALPPGHALSQEEQIAMRSLADELFILCPKEAKPEMYEQIVQLCEQSGFVPNVVQEASPPEVLLGLVASGMGVALVAAGAEFRHQANVVYRPLSTNAPVLEVAAVWKQETHSLVLDDFIALVATRSYEGE